MLVLDYYSNHDISNKLIEDDIVIDRKVEFSEVFKFAVSHISMRLNNDGDSILDYFSYANLKRYVLGLQITNDGVPKFWGNISAESVYYNENENEIRFTVVDWYKWLMENINDVVLPALGADNYNLTRFFLTLLPFNFITGVDLYVGNIPETFISAHYISLMNNKMNAKDFIIELQKNFGAFIYIGADRRLKLVNRGKYLADAALDITDDIFDDDEIEEQRLSPNQYTAILCNVRGNWKKNLSGTWEMWEGWSLFWYNETVSNYQWITGVDGDLADIPKGMKYIDLRQKLTFSGSEFTYSFSSVLFNNRDASDRFNDFKTVTLKQVKTFCSVNRTDLELFAKVKINTNDKLQVHRIRESLLNETMELELVEVPDDK